MSNTPGALRWLSGGALVAAAVLWLIGVNVADGLRAMLLFGSGVCLNVGVLGIVGWVAVDLLAEEHRKSIEPLIVEQRRLADAMTELACTTAELSERSTPGQ